MRSCLIISGGEFTSFPDDLKYEYVIAVDRGVEYALRADLLPDIILGDFDSCDPMGPAMQAFHQIPVIMSPIRKDDTDTMIAVKHAIELNYDHILIICGMGLRTDHLLANIQSMAYAAKHGCICEMISDKEHLRTLTPENGTLVLPKPKDSRFLSLLALTDSVKELCISGTDYDGTFDISNDFPIGHGNRILCDSATISIKEGVLLITESCEQ